VRCAGRTTPATSWRDYARTPDARYVNTQRVMRNTFWVSSYMFILMSPPAIHNFCTNRRMFDIIETFPYE
jgi:hypothetical protein